MMLECVDILTLPQHKDDMARQLLINIYEGDADRPIIGHVFFGTQTEVDAVIAAHKKTDQFFKAAMEDGQWKGMTLHITQEWLT